MIYGCIPGYVVGDYLTVNGGFDENGVKNALVLNKGISIEDNNGITVDATLAKADYDSKVIGNTLTLGEGAALVLTDKAFGADKTGGAITSPQQPLVRLKQKQSLRLSY